MRNLTDPIRLKISELILAAVQKLYPQSHIQLAEIYDQLVEPPNLQMGDLAFGCFRLAKEVRLSPPKIALDLKTQIADPWVENTEAAGPYLNFRISADGYAKGLLGDLLDGSYFKRQLSLAPQRTMVEFSQPNTHKELHVGHMRNACLGDSIVKTMRYAGVPVISATFPGDVGTHVAKCLWYLKYRNKEALPTTERGEWLGKIYSKAHLLLEDEEKIGQGEENKKQLTQILQQLEAKQGEFFDQWKSTRAWSIELMSEVYAWAGIQFDQWYWESEVDSPSVDYVKELYQQGQLQKSEGAIGMDLSAENLGFCLLLKSDGTGLYATKDLQLAKLKFQNFAIERSIYVVDMRQALHFKQVFKTLEKLGFAQAGKCFHLQYNFVELPDGAMSSRKGNIVPLMRLVHSMEKMVKEKYLSRYAGEWQPSEMDLIASEVAKGAIKYGMLRIDNNKKIVFDMDEWLKIDGESGPFVQYSAARIKSLCRKLGFDDSKIKTLAMGPEQIQWELLKHPAERNLLQGLLNFNEVAFEAAETYRPSILCTYLYNLAKRFNLFYHDCSVAGAETEALKQARLLLSYATGQVLEKGLALLGIPTPNKM